MVIDVKEGDTVGANGYHAAMKAFFSLLVGIGLVGCGAEDGDPVASNPEPTAGRCSGATATPSYGSEAMEFWGVAAGVMVFQEGTPTVDRAAAANSFLLAQLVVDTETYGESLVDTLGGVGWTIPESDVSSVGVLEELSPGQVLKAQDWPAAIAAEVALGFESLGEAGEALLDCFAHNEKTGTSRFAVGHLQRRGSDAVLRVRGVRVAGKNGVSEGMERGQNVASVSLDAVLNREVHKQLEESIRSKLADLPARYVFALPAK